MTAAELDAYFTGKADSYEIFQAVAVQIDELGSATLTVGKQISYGNKRKFAWFWLYNVSGRNPSGTLHLQLAIDGPIDDEHVRNITQVGASRWNHQIVLRTKRDATSGWLKVLLARAYQYGTRAGAQRPTST